MPSISPRKPKPKKLYTIDVLLQEKADRAGKPLADIRQKAAEVCGISLDHFRRVRRSKKGQSGYLSTAQLIALAKFFGVGVESLLSK